MDQPPLHDKIAQALERLSALARAREQQAALAETLSPLQARALVVLARRGSLRVGEVARELMVTDGTVSAALSTLEQKGLVTKFQDPDEHRATRIDLTRRGRAAAHRASGWAPETLLPAVTELPAEESGALLATLLKLILSLERSGAIAAARMCVSCRHFVPGGGDRARPHFCRLLGTAIGATDLRVDCAEHERADEQGLDGVAARLRG